MPCPYSSSFFSLCDPDACPDSFVSASILPNCSTWAGSTSRCFALTVHIDLTLSREEMESILANSVRCLHQMAPALGHPVAHDDINKIDLTFRQYAHYDIQHATMTFPRASNSLCERMGIANALRRMRFRDMEFEYEQHVESGETGPLQAPPHQPSYPDVLSDLRSVSSETSCSGSKGTSALSDSTAPTSHPASDQKNETESVCGVSLSSPPSRKPRNRVPEPPDGIFDEENLIQCPYCFGLLDDVRLRKDWERHVYADLQPYICTYGSCSATYRTFTKRTEWQEHEQLVHQARRVWVCFSCKLTEYTLAAFKSHMEGKHADTFTPEQLPDILELCAQTSQGAPPTSCLLCQGEVSGSKDLKAHVAQHLEKFALFALPGTEGDENEDDTSVLYELEDTRLTTDKSASLTTTPRVYEEQHLPDADSILVLVKSASSSMDAAGSSFMMRRVHVLHGEDLNEAQALTRLVVDLRHPHIIQIVDAFLETPVIYNEVFHPVLELSLNDYLLRASNRSLPNNKSYPLHSSITAQIERWFGCLSGALSYIHGQNISHSDINLDTLFVKGDHIYYTGFSRLPGPTAFESDMATDVVSLGLVFLDMLSVCLEEPVQRRQPNEELEIVSWLLHLVGKQRFKDACAEANEDDLASRGPIVSSEGKSEDAQKDSTPDTKWTKLDRKMVSATALDGAQESYVKETDHFLVRRCLSQVEIDSLTARTRQILSTETESFPAEWCFAMLQSDSELRISAKAVHSTIYTAHRGRRHELGKHAGFMGRCQEDTPPFRGPLHLLTNWPEDPAEMSRELPSWREVNKVCGYPNQAAISKQPTDPTYPRDDPSVVAKDDSASLPQQAQPIADTLVEYAEDRSADDLYHPQVDPQPHQAGQHIDLESTSGPADSIQPESFSSPTECEALQTTHKPGAANSGRIECGDCGKVFRRPVDLM